jgi:hypothetical protein
MLIFIFLFRLKSGQEGGASALVAFWNAHAFVGEPEPLVPLCPHSNR